MSKRQKDTILAMANLLDHGFKPQDVADGLRRFVKYAKTAKK